MIKIAEANKVKNIKQLLVQSANMYKNKILYIQNEISYKELLDKVKYLGTFFMEMGLNNKKIAIISENRYEWELTYFAIVCTGNIAVPIDKNLTKVEINRILERAEVEVVFCSERYYDILNNIKLKNENLKCVISIDSEKYDEMLIRGQELVEAGDNRFIENTISTNDIASIMFTSGTTDKSKAVMLSHKNICSNIISVASVFDVSSKDVALAVLPLYHVLEGIFCCLISIYKGASRVYCNDLKDIIEYLNKYKISFMGAVPAIYEYIHNRIIQIKEEQKLNLDAYKILGGNINILMSGGASLNSALEEMYRKLGINLVQGYGITETAPVISMSNSKTYKLGSVGKIIPGVMVKIINKDDDGIGEIIVKGPNVMCGYYNDEEATNQAILDKWFYTGDLGKIDEEGYLYLYGRSKNLIVFPNGKKVFPEEIEGIINQIYGVKESLVFDNGENVKLIVEIVYDKTKFVKKSLEEIEEILLKETRKINEILPTYKHINYIVVTDESIKKTAIGKINRKEEIKKINKKNKYIEIMQIDKQKDINDAKLEKIKHILSTQLDVKKSIISRKSNLIKDLGADSLDRVEIILKIEKEYKIKITKEEAEKIILVEDIIKYIR